MVRHGLGIEVGSHGGGAAVAEEEDRLGLGCKEKEGSILYGTMTWDERRGDEANAVES